MYSKTPLNRTPLGPDKMLCFEGIPVRNIYMWKSRLRTSGQVWYRGDYGLEGFHCSTILNVDNTMVIL